MTTDDILDEALDISLRILAGDVPAQEAARLSDRLADLVVMLDTHVLLGRPVPNRWRRGLTAATTGHTVGPPSKKE